MRRRPKLLLALVVIVLGAGAFSVLRKRRAATASPPNLSPSWPPFEPTSTEAVAADAAEPTDWVAPVDGQCPDGYPIKANANSGIFHVPEGRFYARTIAERCYATAEAAERDGYRRAKA